MMSTSNANFGPRVSTPASFPASSRPDDGHTSIPANTYLFRRDGLSANSAGIYLKAVLDACRSSGQNLTMQSAVTRLVYHKKEGMPFHEYLTAHVVYIVDGVIHPEFSAEVDFHRFVDKDFRHLYSKPHLVALLRNTPLVGVDHHALKQHYIVGTSRPLRDIVRIPFMAASASSTFDADDTIDIRPMSGGPFDPRADKAQAVLEFLEPARFPFSLERLASLVDFATLVVAPIYNPIAQNCYHMSSWIWNAVIQLARAQGSPVDHSPSDLKAMGRFGRLRLLNGKSVTGPFLLSDTSVTAAHLADERRRWNDYREKCELMSVEKLETMRRMENEKRAMEEQVAAAQEEARLAKEQLKKLEKDVQVLRSRRHTVAQQSRRRSIQDV